MKTLDYLHLNESTSANVMASLKQLLADFQVHYMNLRGFHWNIKGRGFFVLHAKFEELYNDAAEKVDQIAERHPDAGRLPLQQVQRLPQPLARGRDRRGELRGSGARTHPGDLPAPDREERKLLSQASEAGDEVTVSMMTDYLEEQEKMVWMLCAYADGKPSGECGK